MKLSKLIFSGLALTLIILSSFSKSISSGPQKPNEKLLVGRWRLVDIKNVGFDIESLTPEQKSMYKKRMQETKLHSIFEAKSDGSYHHVSWVGEEVKNDGKWKFTPDGKGLILSSKSSIDTVGVIITGRKMEWDINGNKVYYKK